MQAFDLLFFNEEDAEATFARTNALHAKDLHFGKLEAEDEDDGEEGDEPDDVDEPDELLVGDEDDARGDASVAKGPVRDLISLTEI